MLRQLCCRVLAGPVRWRSIIEDSHLPQGSLNRTERINDEHSGECLWEYIHLSRALASGKRTRLTVIGSSPLTSLVAGAELELIDLSGGMASPVNADWDYIGNGASQRGSNPRSHRTRCFVSHHYSSPEPNGKSWRMPMELHLGRTASGFDSRRDLERDRVAERIGRLLCFIIPSSPRLFCLA